MIADLVLLKQEIQEVGLELNTAKCEVYCCSANANDFDSLLQHLNAVCPGIRLQTEDS